MLQSNSIRNGIVILIAFVMAIWLGVSVVTEQTETLLKVGGAILLFTCIFLGRRVWLLFIFFNAMNFPLLMGFSTAELGQTILIGFTMLILLMRRQPLNFKFTELEAWWLLVFAMIAQVYMRNPVGLNVFGASAVGARPYFLIALAFATSLTLANIVVPAKEIKWSMWITITGFLVTPFLYRLRGLASGGGAGGVGGYERGAYDPTASGGRNSGFGGLSVSGAKCLAAFVSPLRQCIHPIWGPLMLITLALAAASGYRNNVAAVGLIYLIALAYRGGFPSVIIATFLGALGLGVLALLNLAVPLPGTVQRALSPFPGTWDARYVEAAESSTEWRVDMWKEALFTEYWIHNKLMGDGLGLTAREHMLLQALNDGESIQSLGSGMSSQQEAMMITGGYHSGPVQCVRIIGYVGLLIVILAMIRTAVHAHRQIIRCRGTEWFPVALFFGIPIIALPFLYVLIFGDFGRDISFLLISIGMMRLLEKNLPLPPYVKKRREPYVLMRHRSQNAADSQARAQG